MGEEDFPRFVSTLRPPKGQTIRYPTPPARCAGSGKYPERRPNPLSGSGSGLVGRAGSPPEPERRPPAFVPAIGRTPVVRFPSMEPGEDHTSSGLISPSALVTRREAGQSVGFGLPQRSVNPCLLYTSDAADDLLCVDLGGRRIIKKKK